MSESERVTVETEDRIARVMLNRPDKHNALDREMFSALTEAGRRLAADRSVRAVVLAGAGENFCAGIDVSVFDGAGPMTFGPADLEPRESGANFFQTAALVWRELPVPVIAAVHGAAFGAGLQIALGADLRLATPASRWSVMEIEWGIIPDMGISVTARGIVPPDRLKRLALTACVIDGVEAWRQGLVTAIRDDAREAAMNLARDIAARSPDAVRAVKALLTEAMQDSEAKALAREAALQAALLGSANQLEAVAANLDRRAPTFSDPDV